MKVICYTIYRIPNDLCVRLYVYSMYLLRVFCRVHIRYHLPLNSIYIFSPFKFYFFCFVLQALTVSVQPPISMLTHSKDVYDLLIPSSLEVKISKNVKRL